MGLRCLMMRLVGRSTCTWSKNWHPGTPLSQYSSTTNWYIRYCCQHVLEENPSLRFCLGSWGCTNVLWLKQRSSPFYKKPGRSLDNDLRNVLRDTTYSCLSGSRYPCAFDCSSFLSASPLPVFVLSNSSESTIYRSGLYYYYYT